MPAGWLLLLHRSAVQHLARRSASFAGPNGAGKTTFAGEFLPKAANCSKFVNADLIVAGQIGRRRFAAGLHNLETIYKPVVNEWAIYENSGPTPILLEEGANP